MNDCCHHILNRDGEVIDSFPLLCVGIPDEECCEEHGPERVFPPQPSEGSEG